MSLSSNVSTLATRIATEFNTVRQELLEAGANVFISETAPTDPTISLWFDSSTGTLYIKYDNTWVSQAGPKGDKGDPAVNSPTDSIVSGRLNADLTVTSGSDVVVPFIDLDDPNNWWDATNKRFQPDVAGYYVISYQTWWQVGSGANQVNSQMRKSGATVVIAQDAVNTAQGKTQSATKVIYLNGTTDYIDFTVYTGATTSQVLAQGTANGSGTYFTAALITAGAGPKGDTGETGETGATGPANTLTVGTVTSGTSPAVTITGTAPSQTIDFVLQKGDKGDKGDTGSTGATGATGAAGPANTLTVGTVTSGTSPAVTITGTSPNQTIDFVLQKGDKGDKGDTGDTGPGVAGVTATATELNYSVGVTSAIQSQIDAKANILSPTITTANFASTSATVDPVTISTANGHGGTGYAGLMKLENSSSGATNPKKFIRMNNTGALEIVNNAYNGVIFTLTDSGVSFIGQATGVTNNTPTGNALSLNNHSYVYDDGNMHINANDGAIWINSNNAQPVQINTQGTASGGGLTVGGKVSSDNTGDSGWVSVSSGFTNSFSGTDVAYRKLNNVLYLRGRVSGGSAGNSAFTLPVGYRPATDFIIPTQQFGTSNITYTTVQSNGTVNPNSSATWLTGIAIPLG